MTGTKKTNTVGDYILKEMDKMLYEHVPFKTIAQKINEALSAQDIDYSISTDDVERYAMEHFFNEAKEDLDVEVLEAPELAEVQASSSDNKSENFNTLYNILNSIDDSFTKISDCFAKHYMIFGIIYLICVFCYNLYCGNTYSDTIVYTFFMAWLYIPVALLIVFLLSAVPFITLFLKLFVEKIERKIGN